MTVRVVLESSTPVPLVLFLCVSCGFRPSTFAPIPAVDFYRKIIKSPDSIFSFGMTPVKRQKVPSSPVPYISIVRSDSMRDSEGSRDDDEERQLRKAIALRCVLCGSGWVTDDSGTCSGGTGGGLDALVATSGH